MIEENNNEKELEVKLDDNVEEKEVEIPQNPIDALVEKAETEEKEKDNDKTYENEREIKLEEKKKVPSYSDDMPYSEKVRKRIDMDIAKERIEGIKTPVLVMGRDEDHLQGIFKTSFDLLDEAGKDVEWVSYDHDYHGYVFPIKGDDGKYILNDVQIKAIDHVISWLGTKFTQA